MWERKEPAAPKLADDRAHPREHVAGGLGERGRQQRERGQDRDRVPVHRPDDAGEAVEAEPRTPVQIRLEVREGEAARDVEADGADGQPPQPQPRGDALRVEPGPLAHSEGGEPHDEDGSGRRYAERDERDRHEAGAAGGALQHARERARLERVGEHA